MSAQYSRPIRQDIPLLITYPKSGPAESYALLHAEGCSHTQRKGFADSVPFAGDEHYYSDDFFMVAPCAKLKGKARGAAAK